MKKVLSILVCLLTNVLMVQAGSDLKVVSGSADFTKESAKAIVTVIFTNCKWEKKEDFKSWCGEDYDQRVNSAAPAIMSGFNLKSKGLKIVTDASAAKYKINFGVRNMQRKQGMGFWGSCYIKLYGTITVTEISSGNTVCVIEVDGQSGDTDFVENDRIEKAFVGVGEEMASKRLK